MNTGVEAEEGSVTSLNTRLGVTVFPATLGVVGGGIVIL